MGCADSKQSVKYGDGTVGDNTQTLDMIISEPGNQVKQVTNKRHYRLYTHNLCPFATRARYAFALKGIHFQEVQMDMGVKAQWHTDFNGGTTPVLETPQGELIKESAIIQQFAIEKTQMGVPLIPRIPIEAAKMRVEIERLNKFIGPVVAVTIARGEDSQKNREMLPFIKEFDAMIAKANGNFLFGTRSATLLDVSFAPFLELIHDWKAPSVMCNVHTDCEWDVNAKNIDIYIQKWRAQPELRKLTMMPEASRIHWKRSRDSGAKQPLVTDYLKECFAKSQ